MSRDAGQVADEIVKHLAGLVDTDVEVRIEITAKSGDGFDDEVVRTVTENARTLKFDQLGFEEACVAWHYRFDAGSGVLRGIPAPRPILTTTGRTTRVESSFFGRLGAINAHISAHARLPTSCEQQRMAQLCDGRCVARTRDLLLVRPKRPSPGVAASRLEPHG
jgi:hypothetical protein